MRVLAFDTTCAACSVVLWNDGVVEAEYHDPMLHGQAEVLMPAIENVMTKAGKAYQEIDRIGVTVGPGSFTGVRVGLATARSLAVAIDRPSIGVLTSAVLARDVQQSVENVPVAVAIDARRAEIYLQCFGRDGTAPTDPVCLMPDEAAQKMGQVEWTVVGDGAEKLRHHISAHSTITGPTVPSAVVLADIVSTEPLPDHPPSPVYVRLQMRPCPKTADSCGHEHTQLCRGWGKPGIR